ncbi:MAG: hypothetical protein A2Z34_00365 [Planctomycetes bacterium RBG_16_59_8]|nr:MAG: hypothetical protein A2Z34_00365 [Planctomycetes bacterium RBG_16_59_8]
MSSRYPRINMVVEPPLYGAIRRLARDEGISISRKARDLVRNALELVEDIGLDIMADERARTFDPKKAITHRQLLKRLGV